MATNTHLLLEIASPKCSSILIQRLPGSGMKPSNSRVEQWLVTHQSSSGARKSEREREEPAATELWNPSLKELLELDTSGGSFYSGPAAFWSCNISDDSVTTAKLKMVPSSEATPWHHRPHLGSAGATEITFELSHDRVLKSDIDRVWPNLNVTCHAKTSERWSVQL